MSVQRSPHGRDLANSPIVRLELGPDGIGSSSRGDSEHGQDHSLYSANLVALGCSAYLAVQHRLGILPQRGVRSCSRHIDCSRGDGSHIALPFSVTTCRFAKWLVISRLWLLEWL